MANSVRLRSLMRSERRVLDSARVGPS